MLIRSFDHSIPPGSSTAAAPDPSSLRPRHLVDAGSPDVSALNAIRQSIPVAAVLGTPQQLGSVDGIEFLCPPRRAISFPSCIDGSGDGTNDPTAQGAPSEGPILVDVQTQRPLSETEWQALEHIVFDQVSPQVAAPANTAQEGRGQPSDPRLTSLPKDQVPTDRPAIVIGWYKVVPMCINKDARH